MPAGWALRPGAAARLIAPGRCPPSFLRSRSGSDVNDDDDVGGVGDSRPGRSHRDQVSSLSSSLSLRETDGRRCFSIFYRFYGRNKASLLREGMSSSDSLVLRLLASSVRVADRAGNIVRDIMSKGDLRIVDKGVNDLQTEADRSVQRCIMASLNSQFPNVTIIGEEEPAADLDPDWVELSQSDEVLACESRLPQELRDAAEKDICVWVDPLDGTNEYTQGLLDHVTVLIGIALNGKAVAGVMHQPYYNYKSGPDASLGRTIWGVVGVGAFGIERKALGHDTKIVVTTRSHETEAVRNAIAACEPTEVVRVGGAGHKVLLLIEGKAHAYIFASPGCKKWDTCAPEAVLRAMGGMLTDVHGNDYQYHPSVVHQNTGGVLATAFAGDQAWYLSRMPEDVKRLLPSS